MRQILESSRRFLSGANEGIGGVAAIEFAIIGPLMVLLMICTIDLGMGFYRKMQVQNAAQAGAQYAMLRGFDVASITSAVVNATAYSGISASPAPTQFCGCATAAGVESAACYAACPDGSIVGIYVVVSAQGAYTTVLPYPGIPLSYTFASQSTARIQ